MTRSGYDDEIAYWARELALEGAHREYTAKRLTPEGRALEHPAWIDGLIAAVRAAEEGGRTPRALDLGCGPLGTLAHAHERGDLDVVGVDPLAEPYSELRERFGIAYPERLVASTGERLSDVVEDGSVDLIYSRNSLDHAEDVQRCFDEAARALRPGGVLALEVFAYEGFREDYDGLHRFDFWVHDGALGCTDRAGAQALDLATSELHLVTLAPAETPRPAGVGADTTTVRAVFARTADPRVLAELAAATWRSEERARVEQFLDPDGPYLDRVRRGWDAELLRSMYPTWADATLGAVRRADGRPPEVVEVEARSMPTTAWAQAAGHARVRAYDTQADAFVELFARLGLPPHPVGIERAAARGALAECEPGSLDVVHLRDALGRVDDCEALLASAARALAVGGVLLAEGPARRVRGDRWRRPVGRVLFVDGERFMLVEGDPSASGARALDLAGAGFDVRVLDEVDAADPLHEAGRVYRVALVRR